METASSGDRIERIRSRFSRRWEQLVLMGIAVGTILLWQVPFGTYLLWPFTILSTWYHEMGHGLTAIVLGGDFDRLEIFANGSGLAVHRGDLAFGSIGRAFVAAGGLVAPSIVGGVLILCSRSDPATRFCLFGLALLQAASVWLWIRGATGLIVISAVSVLILLVAWRGSQRMRRLALQFLGVQSCIALFQDIGYFFEAEAKVDGTIRHSDTSAIAEALFLPYWVWGFLLVGLSFLILFASLRMAYGSQRLTR